MIHHYYACTRLFFFLYMMAHKKQTIDLAIFHELLYDLKKKEA